MAWRTGTASGKYFRASVRAFGARTGFGKWSGAFAACPGHGVLVNARAETAGLKSTFAPCLQAGRCIVDASCFFEWRHAQGAARGEKYRVARADAEPLHMAALHDGNGHFVILTQAANEQMAPLHDRMPVLLHTPELETLWLQSADMAQAVLDSLPAPALCMTPGLAALRRRAAQRRRPCAFSQSRVSLRVWEKSRLR